MVLGHIADGSEKKLVIREDDYKHGCDCEPQDRRFLVGLLQLCKNLCLAENAVYVRW